MLKNRVPKSFFHELQRQSILVCCFLLVRQSKIKHTFEVSNSYAFNFTANDSCRRQSKAFKRFVNKTPNTKPRFKQCFHFSVSLIIHDNTLHFFFHFSLRFLMLHLVFRLILRLFPPLPLVFFPVSYFRYYERMACQYCSVIMRIRCYTECCVMMSSTQGAFLLIVLYYCQHS